MSSGVEQVVVPNVAGSTLADAQSALSGCGLFASVSEQYSDNVAAGVVISQSVAAGSSVNKGSSVGIVVSRGPENAGVPNVIGSDRSAAISALQAAGFNVSEGEAQYSDSVPAGCVISQDVAGGSQVKKGTTVTIVVSKGQEMVTVPSVAGMTAAEAESRLSQYGIKVTRSEEYSSTVPAGSVISQSISAGGSVAKNTAITIVISKGPELVTVPDVTGMDAASAESKLTQSGLSAVRGSSEYSDAVPEGSVISQSVSAGSKAARNSTVTIVISKGIQSFIVSFDSNGGSSVNSMTVRKGDTLSGLPTPTKDYCDFTGWTYNGSSANGMTVSSDMTLTANWRDKATSDWVAEGSIPAGAKQVDEKWTYTYTTWSTEAALDGYTRTGNVRQNEKESGIIVYIESQPSGLQNNNQYVVGTPTGWDNDTGTRIITSTGEFREYYYWHYSRTKEYYGWGTESTGNYIGDKGVKAIGDSSFSNYNEYVSSFAGSTWDGHVASGSSKQDGGTVYNLGQTRLPFNPYVSMWFYRINIYNAHFTDYTKEFEYFQSREAASVPSGDGVSNVQHLVRYIPK